MCFLQNLLTTHFSHKSLRPPEFAPQPHTYHPGLHSDIQNNILPREMKKIQRQIPEYHRVKVGAPKRLQRFFTNFPTVTMFAMIFAPTAFPLKYVYDPHICLCVLEY